MGDRWMVTIDDDASFAEVSFYTRELELLPAGPGSETFLTDAQIHYEVIGGRMTVEARFAEGLEKKLHTAEKDLEFQRGLFTLQETQLSEVREELNAARVRVAAYEYQMLRLASRRSRRMPEDKALWPEIMYSSYADLLAEFEDYKDAMSAYIGDSRVLEAITQYEINNRHTN